MMKSNYSQPAIAGGYLLEAQAATTYSRFVFGCSLQKNGTGDTTVVFDVPMAVGKFVIVALPVKVNGAAGISTILETPTAGADGLVSQVTITTVNDAHVAIDCGLMVVVFPVPDRD